jgi:serine/threonine-protein kinase
MPFVVGQNVGPYRVMEQLGQGGMATVYEAYHASLDRYVAIKVLHPAFREDPSFTARFTREARVVAKLEHPHIVPIYDYSECEGQPYLVMKFIEGETLKARLARGPLSAEEAVRVVDAVGAALSYAHSKGILHRDIKPSNVLLAPDGGIYLADFGLARIAQSGESTLSSDMLLGTPHYISPEQAQGKKDLDAGTDIYSLGVVMYELAVGRVPFNADTPFSIIHDHIFTPLPMPRQLNPKVPAGVERVLLKALSKNRADRYADVDSEVKAFRDAIHEAVVVPTQAKGSVTTIKLPAEKAPIKKSRRREEASAVEADPEVVVDPWCGFCVRLSLPRGIGGGKQYFKEAASKCHPDRPSAHARSGRAWNNAGSFHTDPGIYHSAGRTQRLEPVAAGTRRSGSGEPGCGQQSVQRRVAEHSRSQIGCD